MSAPSDSKSDKDAHSIAIVSITASASAIQPVSKKLIPILAFFAPMGFGKDTAADMVIPHLDKSTKIYRASFALKLRQALEIVTGGCLTVADMSSAEGKAAMLPAGALGATAAELKTRICDAMSFVLERPVFEEGKYCGDAPKDPFDHDNNPYIISSMKLWAAVLVLTEGKATTDGDSPPETNYTVGRFLQLFGTDVVRKFFGEDVWIDAFERDRLRAKGDICIVTDLRFTNEYLYVKKLGGVTVGIDAGARAISTVAIAGRDKKHVSETQKVAPTIIIDNSGTKAALADTVASKVAPLLYLSAAVP